MHLVKRIFATRRVARIRNKMQAMLDKRQEQQRQLIQRMAEQAGVDLSTLARRAGLVPSTLTRFMNKPVKHMLSARTLSRLAEASGIPVFPQDNEALPRPARIKALLAVAEALNVSLEDVVAPSDRARAWLSLIERLPPSVEDRAFHVVRGMGEAASATEQEPGKGKSLRSRRKG